MKSGQGTRGGKRITTFVLGEVLHPATVVLLGMSNT